MACQRWHIFGLMLGVFWTGMAGAQVVGTAPDQLRQRYQEALELISQFQFDRAQQLLSECYIREPENIDYLSKIAYCNFQSGRYPDAKLFYQKVLKLDSINAHALSSLGTIYEREANYRQASAYYLRLITIDSTNSYYYKLNGFTALRLGNPLPAAAFFIRAHQLNKADMETIDQLSDIYLALGQLDYAEEILKKGFNLDPNNLKLIYNQARLEQKRNNHPAVVEAIQQAMAQGDTSDYYQMMLGVAYLHLDSADQAISHLQAIISREKDTEYTHHYLGLAYKMKGETGKSILHLQKAIEKGLSEKMPDFHADLAAIMEEQNRHKEAILHYRSALELRSDPEWLFHLARNCDLYYKDKKIALKYYEDYLNGGHPKFQEYARQRIKQIREYLHFAN